MRRMEAAGLAAMSAARQLEALARRPMMPPSQQRWMVPLRLPGALSPRVVPESAARRRLPLWTQWQAAVAVSSRHEEKAGRMQGSFENPRAASAEPPAQASNLLQQRATAQLKDAFSLRFQSLARSSAQEAPKGFEKRQTRCVRRDGLSREIPLRRVIQQKLKSKTNLPRAMLSAVQTPILGRSSSSWTP